MKVMVIVKASEESEAGVMPEPGAADPDGRLQRGAGQGRHHARRGGPASDLQGRAREVPRRHRDRRPVRRDQGTDRRLLAAGRSRRSTRRSTGSGAARSRSFPQGEVEIRPVFEADDFGEAFTPELRAQEERILAEAARTQA